MKKVLMVGVACLALIGCDTTQDPSQSPMPTHDSATRTTEALEPETATATAAGEPAETTEKPQETEDSDLVDPELLAEDDPDPDAIAALVDELVEMSERQYKRQVMRPLVEEMGDNEFCETAETGEAIDNPGGAFVVALFFGAALSDNTTEDSYTEEQMRRLAEWTNDVYADVCGWEAPVVVHDPGEAEANNPEVLELLDGTIAGYTMSTWGEHVRSQDPAVQAQYCHAIETGADLTFAADGLDVTPDEAAAIGIWTMNEMFDTCYG